MSDDLQARKLVIPDLPLDDSTPIFFTDRELSYQAWHTKVAAMLGDYQGRLEAGDEWALFEAVAFCYLNKIPLPDWLGQDFVDKSLCFALGISRDLGAAFNVKRKKNWQQSARKKAALKSLDVHSFIESRLTEGVTKPAVFEEAGEKFFISASTARDLYYDVRRRLKLVTERYAKIAARAYVLQDLISKPKD